MSETEFYLKGYLAYPTRRNYPTNETDEKEYLRGWYAKEREVKAAQEASQQVQQMEEPDGRSNWLGEYHDEDKHR